MIKQPRFGNTTGICNSLNFMHQITRVMRHTLRLILRIEAFLQVFIMRCNAGWTGVFIALQ